MTLIVEDAPTENLNEVVDMIGKDVYTHLSKVKEFPLGAYILKRKNMESKNAWDASPEQIGWLYIIVDEGKEEAEHIRLALCKTNDLPILYESSGDKGGHALINAIRWAELYPEGCIVRFLIIPNSTPVFWVMSGIKEVFFSFDHGFIVSGVEFAASLKALVEGVESTDWIKWDFVEEDSNG